MSCNNRTSNRKCHNSGFDPFSTDGLVDNICKCGRENFEPKMTVYCGDNCHQNCHCTCHDRQCGCGGCCGYCPIPISSCCNICEQQMKNVLAQLITLYPATPFAFLLEGGQTISGTPIGIIDTYNKGLIRISGGATTPVISYVNICKICQILISGVTYNEAITYLPKPFYPSKCGCEESIREMLPVGTTATINLNGTELPASEVVASEVGIFAITAAGNLRFISTCKANTFTITP